MSELFTLGVIAILVVVVLFVNTALLCFFQLVPESVRVRPRKVFAACLFMVSLLMVNIITAPSFAQSWTELDWYCPSQAGWDASNQEMFDFISESNKEYDPRIKVLGVCSDLSDNVVYVAWSPQVQPLKSVIGSTEITSPEFIDGMRVGFNQVMRASYVNSLEAVKKTFYKVYGVYPIVEAKYSNDPEFLFGNNHFAIVLQARVNIVIPGVYATKKSVAVGRVMLKRAGQVFMSEINYSRDLSGEVTIYDLVDSFVENNTLPEQY